MEMDHLEVVNLGVTCPELETSSKYWNKDVVLSYLAIFS